MTDETFTLKEMRDAHYKYLEGKPLTEKEALLATSRDQAMRVSMMPHDELTDGLQRRREYFANYAPEEPDWFTVPTEPQVGKTAVSWDDVSNEDRKRVGALDGVDKLVEMKKIRQRLHKEVVEPYHAWTRRVREDRYFRWRWYYADRMLKYSDNEL